MYIFSCLVHIFTLIKVIFILNDGNTHQMICTDDINKKL